MANENTVAVLEELLEKAKSGEIVGVCAAILYHDKLAGYRIGGFIGGYAMLGALNVMHQECIEIVRDM